MKTSQGGLKIILQILLRVGGSLNISYSLQNMDSANMCSFFWRGTMTALQERYRKVMGLPEKRGNMPSRNYLLLLYHTSTIYDLHPYALV